MAQAVADATFGKKINAMAKGKKALKKDGMQKIGANAKSNDISPDRDQIIEQINEETRVLKGIIQRFSKPVSANDENK